MVLKLFRITGLCLGLYLPLLSTYLSPHWWFVFELIALSLPIYFLLILVLYLYLLKRKKITLKYTILLVPYLFFINDFVLLPSFEKDSKNDCFSITSFNVKSFNYHELVWKKERMKKTIASATEAAGLPGDILCFQEFYRFPTGNEASVDTFFSHPFIIDAKIIAENEQQERLKKYAGLAIVSRYKPINYGILSDTFRVYAMYADFKVNDKYFRLYNCHLLSYILHDKEKYGWKGVPKVISARYRQVDTLLKHATSSPYPVVIAGDMNEAQFTHAHHLLSRKYKSAFKERGSGLRYTYRSILPFYQIDHLFTDPSITVKGAKIERNYEKSDHFPISACISLNK